MILDINLADQTGWDVLRTALKEGWLWAQQIDEDHRLLPVVVLSAVRVSPHHLADLPKPLPNGGGAAPSCRGRSAEGKP